MNVPANKLDQFDVAQQYKAILIPLAAALNKKANDGDTIKKVNEGNATSITSQLKEYATATDNDGIDVETARAALALMLTSGGVKEGTRKASGNHFAGFRAMLSDTEVTPEAFQKATVRDAQLFIASEESKAKAEAKKEWQTYTKDWSSEQWNTFLMAQGVRHAKTASESEGEGESVTEGEQADLTAALATAKAA